MQEFILCVCFSKTSKRTGLRNHQISLGCFKMGVFFSRVDSLIFHNVTICPIQRGRHHPSHLPRTPLCHWSRAAWRCHQRFLLWRLCGKEHKLLGTLWDQHPGLHTSVPVYLQKLRHTESMSRSNSGIFHLALNCWLLMMRMLNAHVDRLLCWKLLCFSTGLIST